MLTDKREEGKWGDLVVGLALTKTKNGEEFREEEDVEAKVIGGGEKKGQGMVGFFSLFLFRISLFSLSLSFFFSFFSLFSQICKFLTFFVVFYSHFFL